MTDRTDEMVFVGFWKRVLATLIDVAIGLAIYPIAMHLMNWSFVHRNILPMILLHLMLTVVLLWVVVRFGGTPGKLIIGVRIVGAGGDFLSWGRAVRRIIFPSLISTLNSDLQIWRAVTTFPNSIPHLSIFELGAILNEYGKPFTVIGMIIAWSMYIDIGAILFNRRKRAIHDFIAGSYVITKKSYKDLGEPSADGDGLKPAS